MGDLLFIVSVSVCSELGTFKFSVRKKKWKKVLRDLFKKIKQKPEFYGLRAVFN